MPSKLISVTSLATSVAFKLSTSQIVKFIATNSGSNSIISYIDDYENTLKNVTVTATVAALNTATANTIPVTVIASTNFVAYLNADFFASVSTTGSGATIKYDNKTIAFENIVVTDTPAAIQTLVNALTTVPTFTSAVFSDPNIYANATTITAFATGGQASATALIEEFNNVTVVATAGDSVKLPTAAAGLFITVKNSGAAALDIFPFASDSIDALAINLAVRIQPGSVVSFRAISSVVWESNIDVSFTLVAPTTASGQLELKAANSAGNTVTTITNASQAAARTYTVPDAGASASFVMTEGAATVNGIKTFGSGIVAPVGAVGTPSIQIGAVDTGLYLVSATQTGFSQDGVLVGTMDPSGFTADSLRARVNQGTTPVGTVSIVEYSNGKDVTTVLTLTNFIVGALAGAAANLGVGNIVYAYPAGQHFELVYSMSSIVLTCLGTAVATDSGLGSVIASGAVAVLSGTATFEDRLTGQTINTAAGGGAAVSALTAATAGIGTGIALNVAASVKNVFFNAAGAWNADNVSNLTATGTIVLKWSKMS